MISWIKRDWNVGLYQWMIVLIYSFCSIPWNYANQAIIFITPKVQHWCYDGAPSFVNLSLNAQQAVMDASCTRPDVDFAAFSNDELVQMNFSDFNRTSCDNGYVFKRELFAYTATERYELVCDRAWLRNMINTAYMFGFFIAAFGSGALSDRFGRRRTMLVFAFLGALTHIGNALVPNIVAFIVLRVVTAVCDMSAFVCAYIVTLEVVKPQHRKMPNVVSGLLASVTTALLGVIVMYVSNYQHLFYLFSAMGFLAAVTLYFFYPESPRWLVTQNRTEELKSIVDRVERMNGECDLLATFQLEEEDEKKSKVAETANVFDIFRTPILRKRTMIMCVLWFTLILVWYALMFSLQDFGPDVRISMIISAFMELPGTIFILFTVDRLGRQVTGFLMMLLSGLCCLGMSPLVEYADSYALMALALLGKFFASVQFSVIYLHTPELYPTVCRSTGLGMSSTVSRIAGMIAPQISLLNNIWPPFMVVILGLCGLVSAALTPILPDTTGKEMPQTIEEGEKFCADHRYKLVLPSKATRRRVKNKDDQSTSANSTLV